MSVGPKAGSYFPYHAKGNWAKYFLSLPIVDTPGKVFLYNSICALHAVCHCTESYWRKNHRLPGSKAISSHLGIEGMDWETSPQGVNSGGWGLRVKTEDMAKFGELYLQKGMWKGKQILPASWIEEATTFKIDQAPTMAKASRDSNDWAQGYCYQFWRCRHNAFRADGAFGQYIIMMPDQDAVVIITGETANMQDELNLVWTYLLPAFKTGPVAANANETAALKQALSALKLPAASSIADPAIVKSISGRNFTLDSNDQKINEVSFSFQDNLCTLKFIEPDSTYTVVFGG